MVQQREMWNSRVGLVLATAGNAVGLGNFLRFPVQCAENGGGAFMIPYLVSLLLLGIPLMWCEWAMGRYGGVKGHGTTPGIFYHLWHRPSSKYLGVFGILITFGVGVFYVYVMSWTLGYSFFSLLGSYFGITSQEEMSAFLQGYQGVVSNQYFSSMDVSYVFYLISLVLVVYILSKGVVAGLEKLAKYGMPILILFGLVLVVRVFTLGAPDPSLPENSVNAGLGFLWNPDFSKLSDPNVWLAAAGQVFFTLSVGFGAIQTYASYIKKKDDIALNGLSTAATNSFVEVILGGSIAIPIAVAFFGVSGTQTLAEGNPYDFGFASMSLVFQEMFLGQVFGTLWFFLLFIAGITSAVAISQPFMSFLQDEFQLTRKKAALITGGLLFVLAQPIILFNKYGFLDEFDFWLGTFGVTLFACIEVVVFIWLFGSKNAWKELTAGADIKVPRIFYYILKYITPTFLFVLLGTWFWDGVLSPRFQVLHIDSWQAFGQNISAFLKSLMLPHGVAEANIPYILIARVMLVLMFLALAWAVKWSFSHERLQKRGIVREPNTKR